MTRRVMYMIKDFVSQAAKASVQNYPIIFVPGIMGTILISGNDTLWPSTQMRDVLKLAMKEDGLTDDVPGISVGGVIKEGPFGINVYLDLFKFFNKNGYPEGEWLFEFGYDWRKDLRTAAKKLEGTVEKVKTRKNVQRVIILAHSMGGLVARYYAIKNSSNIHILFLLGTPNHGAPKAYAMIKYGTLPPIPMWMPGRPSTDSYIYLTQNMPGVYHLLPNQYYFDLYKEENKGGFFTNLSGKNMSTPKETYDSLPNQKLVENAMTFFEEIGEISHCANTHIFVGHGRDTPGKIVEKRGAYKIEPEMVDTSGDGTVPMMSVERVKDVWEKSRGNIHYYEGIEHTKLASNSDVLKEILQIIQKTSG